MNYREDRVATLNQLIAGQTHPEGDHGVVGEPAAADDHDHGCSVGVLLRGEHVQRQGSAELTSIDNVFGACVSGGLRGGFVRLRIFGQGTSGQPHQQCNADRGRNHLAHDNLP